MLAKQPIGTMGGKSYVEEVKLIGGSANGVGKEKSISLGPRNLLAGIFETNTGTRHDCQMRAVMR